MQTPYCADTGQVAYRHSGIDRTQFIPSSEKACQQAI
jgi:hypothetical protein